MSLVLGIDESGTGAWAGPFYVVGVLVENERTFAEACGGLLNDSKKLADEKRRALVPEIEKHAKQIFRFVATVESIRSKGMKATWRVGIEDILRSFRKNYPSIMVNPDIIIDGPRDRKVVVPHGLSSVTWEPKADAKYPSVMAASIIAKTCRNDDMLALAKDFPGYEWETNAGYGAPKHRDGIAKLGLTPHHRPISGLDSQNALDLFKE